MPSNDAIDCPIMPFISDHMQLITTNATNNQHIVRSKAVACMPKVVVKKVYDEEESLNVVSDEDNFFEE